MANRMGSNAASVVVIVEGDDDKSVIEFLLSEHVEDVRVEVAGSVRELEATLTSVVRGGSFYEAVVRLVIVRDADQSAVSARTSLKNMVERVKEKVHRFRAWSEDSRHKIALVVVPLDEAEGALEDAVVASVIGAQPLVKCVDNMLEKCALHLPKAGWSRSKARLAAVLAMSKGNSLGVKGGIRSNLIDASSPALQKLKSAIL